MDPIAHTLAGATLAQTRLKNLTPLATATLVIGANLPDIDAVVSFLGPDASFYYRRGLTHGIAAMVVLPLLLTAAMMGYDRFRRRRDPDKTPVDPRGLLILSYIGVLSHPLLDWLNTYGVRLLMPFDGRWFYGDTLFILDAWMWLLMAAAVVFAYSRSTLSRGFWIVLGVLLSALVTLAPVVPLGAKVVWWIGVAAIVALRIRGVEPAENQRVAFGCVVAFALYVAAMTAGNEIADRDVRAWLMEEQETQALEVMTGPTPANPFRREVVAISETHYHGLEVRFFGDAPIRQRFPPTPLPEPDPIVERALQMEEVRGFANWMRLPTFEVIEEETRYKVVIRDLRYALPDERSDAPGIGVATVYVEK